LPPHRQLRRVGVAFQRIGGLPHIAFGQSVGGVAGVSEVGNPAVRRERKPGDPLAFEVIPDLLAEVIFSHMRVLVRPVKTPAVREQCSNTLFRSVKQPTPSG